MLKCVKSTFSFFISFILIKKIVYINIVSSKADTIEFQKLNSKTGNEKFRIQDYINLS